jgi:DNA repair exonuclease SbcCD nuclease subunit
MRIVYISDLHIEFIYINSNYFYNTPEKIAELFVKNLNEQYQNYDVIVIAGDISHCVADIKKFLSKVDSLITKPLLWVHGNHDIWNWDSYFNKVNRLYGRVNNKHLSEIIDFFEEFSKKLTHTIFITVGKKININGVTFIGDCAYSGYGRFNLDNTPPFKNIYRGMVETSSEERALSKKWLDYYFSEVEKCETPMVVITHTPQYEWGTNNQVELIYYISGHIHPDDNYNNEEIIVNDQVRMDAPNGYKEKRFNFKILDI